MATANPPSQYFEANWRVNAGETEVILLEAPISGGWYATLYRITNNSKVDVHVLVTGDDKVLKPGTSMDVSSTTVSIANRAGGERKVVAQGTYQLLCCSFAPIVFPPVAAPPKTPTGTPVDDGGDDAA